MASATFGPALDWPLSREEKKKRLLHLYASEAVATGTLLKTARAELRRLSGSFYLPSASRGSSEAAPSEGDVEPSYFQEGGEEGVEEEPAWDGRSRWAEPARDGRPRWADPAGEGRSRWEPPEEDSAPEVTGALHEDGGPETGDLEEPCAEVPEICRGMEPETNACLRRGLRLRAAISASERRFDGAEGPFSFEEFLDFYGDREEALLKWAVAGGGESHLLEDCEDEAASSSSTSGGPGLAAESSGGLGSSSGSQTHREAHLEAAEFRPVGCDGGWHGAEDDVEEDEPGRPRRRRRRHHRRRSGARQDVEEDAGAGGQEAAWEAVRDEWSEVPDREQKELQCCSHWRPQGSALERHCIGTWRKSARARAAALGG